MAVDEGLGRRKSMMSMHKMDAHPQNENNPIETKGNNASWMARGVQKRGPVAVDEGQGRRKSMMSMRRMLTRKKMPKKPVSSMSGKTLPAVGWITSAALLPLVGPSTSYDVMSIAAQHDSWSYTCSLLRYFQILS